MELSMVNMLLNIVRLFGSGASESTRRTPDLLMHPRTPRIGYDDTLYWMEFNKLATWKPLVQEMDKFLLDYRSTPQTNDDISTRCDSDSNLEPDWRCFVNVGQSGFTEQCSQTVNYGYDRGTPCFVIQLENVPGWIPEPYSIFDLHNTKIPEKVKKIMTGMDLRRSYVWIHCDGENPVDKENIGRIKYSPWMGIPTRYYPYENTTNFRTPLMTVQFLNPVHGILINVECQAMVKNEQPIAKLHFAILIN